MSFVGVAREGETATVTLNRGKVNALNGSVVMRATEVLRYEHRFCAARIAHKNPAHPDPLQHMGCSRVVS